LAPGGRLVGALTIDGLPRLVRMDLNPDGELLQQAGSGLRLSPLVSGVAKSL
jgi:protein-L-isoaspartate(D-aspartate) O-methyltransferase